MKSTILLRSIVIACACFFLVTCKKQKGSSSFKVEYSISPASIYFTSITYTDATAAPVTVTDLSTFPGGVKEITVNSGPFDAKLSVQINNPTLSTIDYSISIGVDGQLRTTVPGNVAAMGTNTSTAEIIVQ